MRRAPDRMPQPAIPPNADDAWLQQELQDAQQTVRRLLRQIGKEQDRYSEIARAYNLTVANLMEITRANALLERERDQWRLRAERGGATLEEGVPLKLTTDEVKAIRKAMARLHHPDTGGDAERMKAWNAVLDQLEC